jgi:hypothetical protein
MPAVARARNPKRDESKKRWIDSAGTLTTKELAAAADVPEHRIRKWKSEDKWQQALDKKRPGAQRGNKNAAGHGAPKGNVNAETHGAYSRVHLDSLSAEERAYIEGVTLDTQENMLRELHLLLAKEGDLKRKIKDYEQADPNTLYVDRVVEMLVPKDKDKSGGEKSDKEGLTASMQTVIKASPFDRAMKLEAEYNKNHGRILKLIDTMRAHEADAKRLDLDERRHTLAKQKLFGEYEIDPETGEIIDAEDAIGK